MANQDLETRVNRVEWTIERHDENIKELWDTSEELRKSLTGIHQTLVQIKWFALGFACLYMADQFGLSSIFRLLG
jgi:hypothetical protein